MSEAPKKFYRFSESMSGSGGRLSISVNIHEETFDLIKETESGYWIGGRYDKKWIHENGTSKFAHWNREKAWSMFKNRKRLHLGFVKRKYDQLNMLIELMPKHEERLFK